jgi:anhydro-N-acetylmuramic acid kinase
VFHRALAHDLDRPRPLGILNLGGVANMTLVNGSEEPIACDTGPGNALIDDFMLARTGVARDTDGAAAAQGRPDQDIIEEVLSRPFFARRCPKSLDRNEFAVDVSHLSTVDGAATLAALTAATVARILDHMPHHPRAWIVAGGGARNPTLIRMLAERLAPASVKTAAEVGWSIDCLEAQAFAFLAVRSQKGLPLTFPGTTGAPKPLTGGRQARPRSQRIAV